MELNRKPTPQEERLLEYLIKNASIIISSNWKENLLVRPMKDGEMGSLYLFPYGDAETSRKFGEQISEVQFKDEDGIDVIASLNIDSNGNLFELDIWKTDFGKLIGIPKTIKPLSNSRRNT